MYVYFDVDERTAMAHSPQCGEGSSMSSPSACGLPGEQGFPHRAKVGCSGRPRSIRTPGPSAFGAVLPNKDGLLCPACSSACGLAIGAPHKALVVPERSLGSDQGRKYVFVVTDLNVAERRDVEAGPLQEDETRAISKGLSADDWVITSGLQQLKPGTTVTPEKAPR